MADDLSRRMAATLALVLAIDAALALLAAALLDPWLGSLLAAAGVASSLARHVALSVAVLAVLVAAQLRYARRELLAEADAAPTTAEAHPDLHARVTRLAALADAPVPAVAVADADVPNSFAVGGLRSGTVVVSRGLLDRLDPAELDAVLAHELAHLTNRDALVMTLASFLPALVSDEYALLEDDLPDGARPLVLGGLFVAGYVLASSFVEAPLLSATAVVQYLVAAGVTVLVGGVALGLLATPVVYLARSLSRQREFVADRGSARLTGDPAALASALSTLDDAVSPPTADARGRYEYAGLDGMCLLPHGFDEGGDADDAFRVETRAHPPTAERIDRLRELAAEIATGG
ncbi:M48 family metalloprotease [Salinilacihabitans rarus]|uniref:M48 family metalloprotease n=1 Tax=Salinilacihabitans rarus TaxID=2961596 RepID=UPI0020C87C21|nr:M48 family metalloprotease [Salinilacihabitans rarus]